MTRINSRDSDVASLHSRPVRAQIDPKIQVGEALPNLADIWSGIAAADMPASSLANHLGRDQSLPQAIESP